MDSIRTQLGMLSMFTSQTDELSRKSEVYFINVIFINGIDVASLFIRI